MRTILLIAVAGTLLVTSSPAQQNIVYYPNGTLTGGANYFPFGPARGVRQQQLVPGSVFNNQPVVIQDLLIPFNMVPRNNTITSGEIVYGDFHIQMSVYSGGTLSNMWATNIPNPTTVYRGRLRQRWATSAWFPIGLERPFVWVPTSASDNLVVDFILYNIQDPGGIVPDVNGYHLSAHLDAAVQRTFLLGWPSNQSANANLGSSGIKLGFVLGDGNFVGRGQGCLSSTNTRPSIGVPTNTWPRVGQTLSLQLTNAAPGVPASVILGASETMFGAVPLPFDLGTIGATGCQLWVSAQLPLPAMAANAMGAATQPLPVPNDPSLIGARVRAQWSMIDPGANAASLVTSDYGLLIVGV